MRGRMHASPWIYGQVLQHGRGASYRWRLAWTPCSLHCVPCNASGDPKVRQQPCSVHPVWQSVRLLPFSAGKKKLFNPSRKARSVNHWQGKNSWQSHWIWIFVLNCQPTCDLSCLGVQA